MQDHGYIKALSVKNIADMVYARQVFSEPGMPEGVHLCWVDTVLAIPDSGWIVWHDKGEALYAVMTDREFRDSYTPYGDLTPQMQAICDAHPGYDEWVAIMDKRYVDANAKVKEEV